jgi:predicted TIM-barrel fold metal-dependent hydrolase
MLLYRTSSCRAGNLSLARKCNEYSAQLVSDYPGRFGFFAALPLPDMEGSLREITYALDTLKADGIGLMTNYGDKWPGDPAFAPAFEELNRRKTVVYFHPTAPNCCKNLVPHVPTAFTELPNDTTRAVTSLLYSGSLARFRDIPFIFSHAGGTIPMLAGAFAMHGKYSKEDLCVSPTSFTHLSSSTMNHIIALAAILPLNWYSARFYTIPLEALTAARRLLTSSCRL